ncbi:MAG: PLP-dependent aminotransferase family protein, partial [Acidiferrobacterales bacterium]|nr:PLP-dependent aminotransferase family protein [Acidiferrobacterales bacterium]
SEKLSVSVATVKQAYEELERQTIIEARPKSGYFVRAAQVPAIQPKRVKLAKKPCLVRRQTLIENVFDAINRDNVVPLGLANPVSAHPSDKALARIMRRVISQAGSKAISYGPTDGYLPLKRQIAIRYLNDGLAVNPEELLITNGAQEAISVALQCVAKAGDIIAVESPAYFGVLELIESFGMMALEIPLCPEEGIWLDDLEEAIAKHPIKACVFSTSISNPLGSFMSNEKKQKLVSLIEKFNIPLIEDDVYGDLHFTEKRGIPAQFHSKKGLVLTCSSFSKTAAPGYRIGWLLAGKYTSEARRFKRAFSCSSPLLNQWTLAEFLASGEYERNMRLLRRTLALNKDRMIALIRSEFPASTRVSDPQGAGVLWLELSSDNDSEELFYKALEHDISICPGVLFAPSNKFNRCIRLSYGVVWNDEVEAAVKTVGKLCV